LACCFHQHTATLLPIPFSSSSSFQLRQLGRDQNVSSFRKKKGKGWKKLKELRGLIKRHNNLLLFLCLIPLGSFLDTRLLSVSGKKMLKKQKRRRKKKKKKN